MTAFIYVTHLKIKLYERREHNYSLRVRNCKMASGSAHLSSSKLNLGLLRDFYRREFLECIDRCMGTKVRITTAMVSSKDFIL